jgi:N-dimethylarginine dimethylaminohydrolase
VQSANPPASGESPARLLPRAATVPKAGDTPLDWGRRYLMCPPDAFGVVYEINPWMRTDVPVDQDLAHRQWQALVETLRRAGAEVATLSPVQGLPDMVFTANAGLVDGQRFVPSRFRHLERRPESAHAVMWFRRQGFALTQLPSHAVQCFEGAGDALPFRGQLVAGHRFRSDQGAHAQLANLLGVSVVSLELVDPRFYHVDLTFCPLDARRAIIYPQGWAAPTRARIQQLVPEPLVLEPDEALTFCANSVVVGTTVIMPACPARVGRRLERWGFDVCVCPVDEFLKAGGGVRCLTLALDVVLSAHSGQLTG